MLTLEIGRFAHEFGWEEIPGKVRRQITSAFIDTMATMVAGRTEPVTAVLLHHLTDELTLPGRSSLLFEDRYVQTQYAALINGTAAHALDYDDVALSGHPSTVLVPALVAQAQHIGASGQDLIRAYLVGYETWAELVSRDADPHHTKGWHPTGVFGTVAAAAALGALERLDPTTVANAVALAASMASGLAGNFGTMAKPFHAGRAAQAGIEAVRLGRCGMTASLDVLDRGNGYLMAISPKGRVRTDSVTAPLGARLRFLENGLSVKNYPVCYFAHRIIDGVLDLREQAGLKASDIARVKLVIGSVQAGMLRNRQPRNALEAKFSAEFGVAAAILAGRVDLSVLSDAFVSRDDVQALMTRVEVETTEEQCPIEPVFAPNDYVTVETTDGRVLDSGPIRFPRGNALNPLPEAALREKFISCVSDAPELDAAAVFARLSELESLSDIGGLFCTPAAGTPQLRSAAR